MTEKTNGSKEFWKGIQANCDHADEALERVLNRYPYMKDNGDWNDIAALINGIRMMSYELEAAELLARHVDAAIIPDLGGERPELPAALLASHSSSPALITGILYAHSYLC